jgi:plasmid maintenance system antidote protein VapI
MKATNKFLNDAKVILHLKSDLPLAKVLGVQQRQVARLRNGLRVLTARSAIRLGDILDLDPLVIIAANEKDLEAKVGLADRIHGVATKLKSTIDFLDDAKVALGLASDYSLAKTIGIPPSQITRFRSGKRGLSSYAAMRLGEILGHDPMELLATNEAELEKDEERKEQWEIWAKKLQRIAAGKNSRSVA